MYVKFVWYNLKTLLLHYVLTINLQIFVYIICIPLNDSSPYNTSHASYNGSLFTSNKQ